MFKFQRGGIEKVDRIVYRGMKGWGRSFSSVRGTALPINEFHAWYINQQHHLYCACISAARARILIRWFANTARGHFLLWNKTEPTALLNQYRGLECYRKPRKQTKCIFFQSKSVAKIVLLFYKPEKTWKANEVADVGCHRIFDRGIFSLGTHLQEFSITSTYLQGLSSNTCNFYTSTLIYF